MTFKPNSNVDIAYDNKAYGNIVSPDEWNANFQVVESTINTNANNTNENFNLLAGNTGAAQIGSEMIESLGEVTDSNVRTQILLIADRLNDVSTEAEVDVKINELAMQCVKNVTYTENTGVFTITWVNGTTTTIDTVLEKVPASMAIVSDGNGGYLLRVTNQDGSYTECDVTSLFNEYTFNNSDTISFTQNNYSVCAELKPNSVTDTHLNSAVVDDLNTKVSSANASAISAGESASNAAASAEVAATSEINAKKFSAEASATITTIRALASEADSSAKSASSSATNANTSANKAEASMNSASDYAGNASASATSSKNSSDEAAGQASLAKSWAVGGSGTRTDEDENNSMYFSGLAKASSDTAVAAKESATASADVATTKAASAEASATAASGSATNAANSESAAKAAQKAAEVARDEAEQIAGGDYVTNTKFNSEMVTKANVTNNTSYPGYVDGALTANESQNALNLGGIAAEEYVTNPTYTVVETPEGILVDGLEVINFDALDTSKTYTGTATVINPGDMSVATQDNPSKLDLSGYTSPGSLPDGDYELKITVADNLLKTATAVLYKDGQEVSPSVSVSIPTYRNPGANNLTVTDGIVLNAQIDTGEYVVDQTIATFTVSTATEKSAIIDWVDSDGNPLPAEDAVKTFNYTLSETAVTGDTVALSFNEFMLTLGYTDGHYVVKEDGKGLSSNDYTDDDKASFNSVSSGLSIHTASTNIHTTYAEKTAWNAKADSTDLETHVSDAVAHVTAEEREAWNSGGGGVGKDVAGTVFIINGVERTAEAGAEIFNDYSSNIAVGYCSHAEGNNTTAIGTYSHTEGWYTTASNEGCHAEGNSTTASGMHSHAEGAVTTARGDSSHAEGMSTTARGICSHAEGMYTTASNYFCHAEGNNTTASNYASHSQGKYNKAMTDGGTDMNTVGDAFVIGNGTSSSARSNAFRVTFAGATYGLSSFNSSGADYAEFFEWKDGNPNNEDRVGYFVTCDDGYIQIANSSDDYLLGVVSANPCIIGNSDEDWLGRWEHDEFGRFVKEEVDTPVTEWKKVETGEFRTEIDVDGNEVQVPITELKEVETGEVIHGWRYKANPNYDSTQTYVERKDRQEWDCIGMMGVLAVRDDGTCSVNSYCKVADGGIATAADRYVAGCTYRVIGRVNDGVVKIIFR